MDFDNIIAGKALLKNAVIRVKDVKAVDLIFFQNKLTGRRHGVVVGEVYSDHIVVYDTGGSYICTMNYKRTIEIPAVSTPAADLAAINKLYEPGLAARWDITRYANFS